MTSADLHCHSTASAVAGLGVQRAVGLPECATPPHEVHALARRRGMDFVTITDHDTIDGCLEIADLPGVFISVELTAQFRGEPQGVHVLCWDITPDDHEWLQAHRHDLERCAEELHARGIAVRAGAPVLRGRRAAHGRAPQSPGAPLPGLGDAQRLARPRAQRARRDLHRDARRNRRRRQRRPRGRRHRAHLDRDPAGRHAAGVPGARDGRPGRGVRRPGQCGEVGARGDRDRRADARPRQRRAGARSPARHQPRPAVHGRRRRARRERRG